jgi:hypothetical protein
MAQCDKAALRTPNRPPTVRTPNRSHTEPFASNANATDRACVSNEKQPSAGLNREREHRKGQLEPVATKWRHPVVEKPFIL